MDILIDKPAHLKGYALHRIVEQHQAGNPALWADEGSQLRIRPRDAEATVYDEGKLLGFSLTACVALRDKDKRHQCLPVSDWRGRKEWFEKQADKHGFEIIGVHIEGQMQKVEAHANRHFSIDATQFAGLLRVTDPVAFSNVMQNGVGRVGRAFGMGMLVVS